MKVNKTKTNWCTPERNTEREITDLNLTPIRRDLVKKKLLTANVIMSEIAATKHGSASKKRSVLHRVVSGKLAQKYRCVNKISRDTGLCRRSLGNSSAKNLTSRKETRKSVASKVKGKIIEFLSR